jgi:Fur family ferric uptake transcriptional regulator
VLRDTQQRRAIRRVFLSAANPLTPDDVLKWAQDVIPSLGIATVYRTLKMLTEEGWLAAVELPGGTIRYEIAARPHHHHFVCLGCAQAFDMHGCPQDVDRLAPQGFTVEAHALILYGRCAACA